VLLLKPLDLEVHILFELQSILVQGLLWRLRLLIIANDHHFLQVARVLVFNAPKFFFVSKLLFIHGLLLSFAEFAAVSIFWECLLDFTRTFLLFYFWLLRLLFLYRYQLLLYFINFSTEFEFEFVSLLYIFWNILSMWLSTHYLLNLKGSLNILDAHVVLVHDCVPQWSLIAIILQYTLVW
jgi:hypothetical protein